MSTREANPMADLYRRLSAVGLTRNFVKKTILPDWWDDEIALKPAGFSEGMAYISRFAGLEFESLLRLGTSPAFRPFPACKFKKSTTTNERELSLARAMATRAAQLVVPATRQGVNPLPSGASQLRAEVLGLGERWVGLGNLLDYCWMVGIPVVHLAEMPSGKRPHGLSAVIEGRPAIVICKNDKHTAWLLFILAHELGHIVLGHVKDGEVLLDEDVKNLGDEDEEAADAFAIELLTGDAERRYYSTEAWPNPDELAMFAAETGERDGVDPGHIVLNYAHSINNFWAVANAALDILEPENGAVELIRDKFAKNLDWSSLPTENAEFLMRITRGE